MKTTFVPTLMQAEPRLAWCLAGATPPPSHHMLFVAVGKTPRGIEKANGVIFEENGSIPFRSIVRSGLES